MSAMTSDQKLVRMANQIATFFRSYPDDEAVAGIHKHIVAFWTPKMRHALVAFGPTEGSGLDPLALQAITEKPQAESPVRAATRDPALQGAGASDAG
ncbi:peptidase [Methylobacterium sp. Leaf469]|jgi:formate dehydrogenase subunit delta|uniref:formate dehydrogenase subunit delta n=1 Tax=unclassified Methylobacterium TaxID=2615210 RepID=UPI0006F8CA99|nr:MULTISPECIES: formate dehydrogenase subunit delta [unclassified Methylobacterium]USU33188.1 formate dehydrogenase subunit delta [Methylobacterium sp. OTU13CASTA1]KQO61932.1 peptidase [Methylobacterium sp. Leaf87]KQP34074.1 peptidase [Methylobacterium sp. Leaf102]KQP36470.1 peptidase [Methylobacterium sp. Leaf100]KQP61971.1 peptidase [Methylobacterium sp. Leaf112]